MPKQKFGEGRSPFSLKSGNNIGGRNGKGVSFKTMGSPITYRGPKPESPESSEVKKASISDNFKNFLKSEQTEEGRKIGDIKRRMRSPNIEVRVKAEKENRERLKNARKLESQRKKKSKDIYEKKTESKSKVKPSSKDIVKSTDESTSTYSKPFQRSKTGDPYSYRISGESTQFQSLRGRGGRTKGSWYDVTDPTAISEIREFNPLTN